MPVATTPIGYSLSFSFTAFEASNPSTPKPGSSMDSEFNAIASSITSIIGSISDVRRADGALNNGIVGTDQLAPSVFALMVSKLNPRGVWVTATAYAVGDLIRDAAGNGGTYICGKAHTSGTFATDKAAGDWIVFATADIGGANMAIPAPASGDTGKWLFATGANNPTWQTLVADFTALPNGTAPAPTIAFAHGADTGLYSPQAGAIGFSSGGVLALEWNATGLTMLGSSSLLQVGRDIGNRSYLATTAASGNAAGVAFQWLTNGSGYVTQSTLGNINGSATLTGSVFSIASVGTPSAAVDAGVISGQAILTLAGGSAVVNYGESLTNFNRWTVGYDQPSNEYRFLPMGAYNMRYTAGTFFIGTQGTALPGAWVNGVATFDAYVQQRIWFGQNGASTFYIDYTGASVLGALTATTVTVNGVLISTATAVPTGSIVEHGPFGGAVTVDAAAGEVVVGIRSDGAGNFYIRCKTLVLG